MKNLNKIFLTLLLLFTVQARLFAQNSSPTFSGTFKYDKKNTPDSIRIWTYPNDNFWDSSIDFVVKVNKDKKFDFTLPPMIKPSMFGIRLVSAGKNTLIGNYYVEPNDNIHIEIFETPILEKDSIGFSGKGAAKYNLATRLSKEYLNYLFNQEGKLRIPKSSVSPDSLEVYLKNNFNIVKQFTDKRMALINSYKDISPEMKKLLDYEQPGYQDAWFSDMYTLYKYNFKGNEIYKKKVKENFNIHYSEMLGQLDEISLLAPFRYQTIAAGRIKTNLLINSEENGVDLIKYYNAVKNSYKGKIRERLLAEFLMSNYTMTDIINYNSITYDSLVLDASKYMVSPSSKEIIAKKTVFKNGANLYNANFIDLNGIAFNLNSLKGKVFLIDIWGLGCGGCAMFHEKFEREIWPFLKDNKKFTVLGVYNGKTKERWIKGIESDLYTSKEYVNISTLPLGSDHSFLKYYNINYAPFLMLVDKDGKIISQISANIPSKELLSLINSALINEKGSK